MSPRRCEVTEDARHDLALQYAWYAEKAGERIAERYLEAFRRATDALLLAPETGAPRRFRDPRLAGLRSLQLPGAFRVHLAFYRVEGDAIVVFRVLHGMRDLPRRLTEPPGASD